MVDVARLSDPLLFQHLRGEISGAPTEGLSYQLFRVLLHNRDHVIFGKTEIRQSNMPVNVDQDVFWLQIAIDDVSMVQMLDSQDQSCYEESCYLLFQELK